MKRTGLILFSRRVAALLLTVLLSTGCLLIPSSAAETNFWSPDKIVDLFSDNDPRYYNEKQFLMKSEEMAQWVAEKLVGDDGEGTLIYDNTKSTATNQKYLLMRDDALGKDGVFLKVGINMEVNKKDDVLSVSLGLIPTDWEDDQLATVVASMADIYSILNGNMTDEKRQQFITDRNITKKSYGYSAEGVFDELYYKIQFSEDKLFMTIKPVAYADLPPIAEYYNGSAILYSEGAFTIRTGELTVRDDGDITLEVDLINKSKHSLLFDSDFARIGGYDISLPIFSEVAPGNTRTVRISIDSAMLVAVGAEPAYDIGLYFNVTDQETREVLYSYGNYISLGMPIRANDHIYPYSGTLFKNDKYTVSVVGSSLNELNGRPQIYLTLDNGTYEYIRLTSEGTCVVGKQEYDMFVNGYATEYSDGVLTVQPMDYKHEKTDTLVFDLQIADINYNDMVSGRVTVKLDKNGKILNITSKMEEISN